MTICLYCGRLLAINADESMRAASDAEALELAGTPELIAMQKFRAGWLEFRARKRSEYDEVQPNGVWAGTILFRCAWAHPVWQDYALLVYDLNSPAKDIPPPNKRDPSATHELMLYALDPEQPVDFAAPVTKRKYSALQPANYGYQFRADSNPAAWARVKGLVDECLSGKLSPDTDWRSAWDARMADGWSLLKGARR